MFFIGLGLLLGIGAYFVLSQIGKEAPALWGFPRHLAVGIPVAVLSAAHLLFGVLLAAFGARIFCFAGAVAATAVPIFYFFFMISATGVVPISLISAVTVAIPILVSARAGKYLSAGASKSS